MPVYLFTFHAYRSWMPNHPRGYTRRGAGYCPPDTTAAQAYELRALQEPFEFGVEVQRILVEEVLRSCPLIGCRCHACTTGRSHVHSLVSWKHARSWQSVRQSLKTSLTKRLKLVVVQTTLSRGGSRKRVRDRAHFEHLMKRYLPDHPGVSWYEGKGWVEAREGR